MTTARSSAAGDRPPYQVMPPLTDEEQAALREDIRLRGVLVPVEIDAETGAVLDGHHRVAIAEDLGIAYPRVVRAGLSHEERLAHAVVLNLNRRHLTPESRAEAVAALRAQGWSTRRIARTTGISQSTVVRDLRAAESDDSTALVTGSDGKHYQARRPRPLPSVYASSAREQQRAQTALQALGADAPGKVIDLRRAERLGRDARAAARRAGPPVTLPATVRINHCDFRNLDIEPNSVDVILTDPPYTAAAFRCGLWDNLGKRAATWLKPGGLLIAYTGQMHLPQALTALEKHLDYWWTYAVLADRGTGTGQVRPRSLGTTWKPLVVFRAPGGHDLPPWSVDVIQGDGRAKDSDHPWQQGVHEAEQILAALSHPGDQVLDPFTGSGTTAVAAARLGRSFIGCDISEQHVLTARQRVADEIAARGEAE